MAPHLLARLRRKPRPDPDAMTLGEHISELRRRLIKSVLAFTVAGVAAWILYPHIVSWLQQPYCRVAGAENCKLYITSPLDGLSLRVKIAAYGGLFLASPIILWQLWRFITPGLKSNEKRYAIPFIAASITLFALGGVLAYYTFPHALRFLDSIGGPSLQQIYNPNSYVGLMLALMAVFGITFEFPVILVSLQLAGVLQPGTLAKWRRWAIVAIVTVAAIITPSGDPFSMIALAVPLYIFYEASILLGRVLGR
ncbi:MAG TPA: twin-arginine translocase subunit TatC [Acidimicrobiales bacterium]|nr:twin-arginine translocase subunit TatC [Acidimicrobiales bacterium]